MTDDITEKIIHSPDNPRHADASCPHSEWMGYDLNHCPGIGDWRCMLQKYAYASDQYGIDSIDYRECSTPDHAKCSVYLAEATKDAGSNI